MALDRAFDQLGLHLGALREGLASLRTTVVEDKPLNSDVALVDAFGDAAEDLLGWLEEAQLAAAEAGDAARSPADLNAARGALTLCQERYNLIAHRFTSDLVVYERIGELVRLGRVRGGEWRGWSRGVREALEWCRPPIYETNEALFACWREIAERATAPTLAVQATVVGDRAATERRRERSAAG